MGGEAAAVPAPDPFMGMTRISYTIYPAWNLTNPPKLPTNYETVPAAHLL